ncbi:MarR family winged helix-turn-helix transcriptional regulator [Saccharomonospora sp. NPDC006951]
MTRKPPATPATSMPAHERVGHHVKRVEQELMALKHAALKPSGLTVPQYSALATAAMHPGVSAAALARLALVTPQTMATTLANLEAKGLISRARDPYHLNARQIELTDPGWATLRQADAAAVAIERKLGETFTETERATLLDLLARCSRTLHEEAAHVSGGNAALAPFKQPAQ